MRICIIGKYPPIQGGVSIINYWIARSLARRGHEVHVITNANEVEDAFRIFLTQEDEHWYQPCFDHGSVRVWNTERFGRKYHYIPQANPFVTKLASLATEVVKSSSVEVILSYYLEPYAVAAYLVSSWTGTPFIVRHAGSDVGRLMKIDQLRRSYTEILRRAHLICTSERLSEFFVSLGVEPNRLYQDPGFSLSRDHFNPQVEPLSINGFLSDLATSFPDYVRSILRWHIDPIDVSIPSVGIYGKIAETKGIFDLVKALAKLKRKGLRFNFIAIAHGLPEREKRFRDAIIEANLEEETRILPFIPHWRIPSFLRSLSAVCFLERGFPIKSHVPIIPREVLSCGTCLIVSGEVACKQSFCERLNHGVNSLIVREPRDHVELETVLEQVIEDPEFAHRIGTQGELLTHHFEDHEACVERHERMFRQVISGKVESASFFGYLCGAEQQHEGALRQLFPLTTKLLGSRIGRVTERLRSTSKNHVKEDRYVRAMEICEVVTSLLEEGQILSDYLIDVMRWELYQVPPESDQLAKIANDMLFRSEQIHAKNLTPKEALELVPVRFENVLMLGFRYDMEKLIMQIREGASAQHSIEEEPSLYLFQNLPLRPRSRVLRIDPQVFVLLELCDGYRTVREIASKLAERTHREGLLFQNEIASLCACIVVRLFSEGLVCLVPSRENCI